MNTCLIGLSVDSNASHLAWIYDIYCKTGIKVPFPIIADANGEIARKYGMIANDISNTETVRNVFIIDDKGIKTEKTQVVIGAKVPEIKVQAIKKLDGNVYYSISIKDEVILKNVKITLNDEEKVNIDVNSSEYTTEIVLQKGFDNKLIIEASNENLTTSKKAQCSLP